MQPGSTPSAHFSLQDYSPEQYPRDSWPLGMSNLRHLNENRPPAPRLESWMREEQCVGPYNNVGSVGRRSEYEGGVEWDGVYRYEGGTEYYGHEDAYDGHNDEGEGTLYDEEMGY
jgi:hypothetical protein